MNITFSWGTQRGSESTKTKEWWSKHKLSRLQFWSMNLQSHKVCRIQDSSVNDLNYRIFTFLQNSDFQTLTSLQDSFLKLLIIRSLIYHGCRFLFDLHDQWNYHLPFKTISFQRKYMKSIARIFKTCHQECLSLSTWTIFRMKQIWSLQA